MFKDKNKLYCFTPEVMIATFLIEGILAVYTLVRYRTTVFGRVAFLILFFLALFQLAEYQICVGSHALVWAKIGIISITLLPVLGLNLILLTCNKNGWFIKSAYAVTMAVIAFLILSPTAVSGAVCLGNYVIFESVQPLYWLYALYYISILVYGMIMASVELKEQNVKKKYLYWMTIGYLSFLLPVSYIYLFYELSSKGIPSIMCGFALIFAFLIVFKILPLYHKDK